MIRFLTGVLMITLVAAGAPIPSWADTDYRCLNACVNDGKEASSCMKTCSYKLQPGSVNGNNPLAVKPTARQFTPLTPDSGRLLLSRPDASSQAPAKDYPCVYKCLQGGSQYSFCEQQCVIKR